MRHKYMIKEHKDEGCGCFSVYDRALPKELAWIETCATRDAAQAVITEREAFDKMWNVIHGHGDDV